MKLVNVRLGREDASMAESLRREGLELSRLVRDAIRARYLEAQRRPTPSDVEETLARIYATYPEPASPVRKKASVHNRRAFQQAVRRKLRSKKR